MEDKRFIYLAKLGIIESTNEEGNYSIQRIDSPTEFAEYNELDFIPPYLSSDEEARKLFKSLTHEQLERLG